MSPGEETTYPIYVHEDDVKRLALLHTTNLRVVFMDVPSEGRCLRKPES